MEDRETARMRKYGESKTTRITMATVPHVTSGLGLRKFQADGFLLTRVYKPWTRSDVILREMLHFCVLYVLVKLMCNGYLSLTNKMQRYTLFVYCCQCCTCFGRFFRSSSGAQKLYMQLRVLVKLVCCDR